MTHHRRRRRGPGRGRRPLANRGDIRAAILALLALEPMHGYQVIQELTERTKGAWEPSPGSVYPTLQQLADEGLISGSDQEGRRVFELTEDGRAAADAAEGPPPWEALAEISDSLSLRRTMHRLGSAARQVAQTGTPEQVAQAREILDDARKRLYQLLAE